MLLLTIAMLCRLLLLFKLLPNVTHVCLDFCIAAWKLGRDGNISMIYLHENDSAHSEQ